MREKEMESGAIERENDLIIYQMCDYFVVVCTYGSASTFSCAITRDNCLCPKIITLSSR